MMKSEFKKKILRRILWGDTKIKHMRFRWKELIKGKSRDIKGNAKHGCMFMYKKIKWEN